MLYALRGKIKLFCIISIIYCYIKDNFQLLSKSISIFVRLIWASIIQFDLYEMMI